MFGILVGRLALKANIITRKKKNFTTQNVVDISENINRFLKLKNRIFFFANFLTFNHP